MSAQIKKGRYVYYHCTGYRGNCGEPYVREEVLDEQLTHMLGELHLEPDVLEWLTQALRSSHEDERRFHDEAVKRLQNEHGALQRRLDAMYVDKLDGRIDVGTFERLSQKWRAEQERLLRAIESHQNANVVYFEEGARLLELASRAQELFARQPPAEKRKLLDCIVSNCSWRDGTLTPNYRKPFDLIWKTNARACAAEKQEAVGAVSNGRFDIWLPEQDSNLQPSG